jgi:hypothetical protein
MLWLEKVRNFQHCVLKWHSRPIGGITRGNTEAVMIKTISAVLAAVAITGAQAGGLGFFREAPEPEPSELKAAATCSLWARYNSDWVVAQEQHFLGGLSLCGGFQGFAAAASSAATGLPTWQSYGFQKVSSPPGPTMAETPYECSVNINFEPATPSQVQVVFTGPAACTAQRGRILAVLKGSMVCNVQPVPCPWSNP